MHLLSKLPYMFTCNSPNARELASYTALSRQWQPELLLYAHVQYEVAV